MSDGNGKPKATDKLAPVQKRMLEKLSDMKEHYAEELQRCLHDEMGKLTNIHAHLSFIRKALEVDGKLSLVTHKYGQGNTCYQLVPLSAVMPHPSAGK